MNNRNLEKLTLIASTKRFCEKYNFSIKVAKGQLVFSNSCVVINIYGYTVEKILYFVFFSSGYKFYEDSDVLLNKVGFDKPFLFENYNHYREIHTTNITDSPNGNNL